MKDKIRTIHVVNPGGLFSTPFVCIVDGAGCSDGSEQVEAEVGRSGTQGEEAVRRFSFSRLKASLASRLGWLPKKVESSETLRTAFTHSLR